MIVTTTAGELRALVRSVRHAVGGSLFPGVYLDVKGGYLRATATDGWRLASATIAAAGAVGDHIGPVTKYLDAGEPVDDTVDGPYTLTVGPGVLSGRGLVVLDGSEFPAWEGALTPPSETVEVHAPALRRALRAAREDLRPGHEERVAAARTALAAARTATYASRDVAKRMVDLAKAGLKAARAARPVVEVALRRASITVGAHEVRARGADRAVDFLINADFLRDALLGRTGLVRIGAAHSLAPVFVTGGSRVDVVMPVRP